MRRKPGKCAAAGAQPRRPTACRIPAAQRPAERNAMPHAMPSTPRRAQSDCMTKVIHSVQSSALHPSTQGLRGEGDLWETLPLNNSPFLTALETAIGPKKKLLLSLRFSYTLGAEVVFYQVARAASSSRRPQILAPPGTPNGT